MARIKVDPEQLRNTSRQFSGGCESLSNQVASIRQAWVHLGTNAWESSARGRVSGAYNRAARLGSQLVSQTHDLARDLDTYAYNFERADGQSVYALAQRISQFVGLPAGGILPSLIGITDEQIETLRRLGLITGDLPEGSDWTLQDLMWVAADPLSLLDSIQGSGQFDVEAAVLSGTVAAGIGALSYGVLGASASGSGHYEFSDGALRAAGQLHAEAYLGKVEYSAELAGIEATADAWAGAEVDAVGSLVFDPKSGDLVARGDVSAFAGARAGVEGEAALGALGAKGHAGVRAGIGVDASAALGVEDGVISIDFSVGAAIGIGADAGFSVDLDTGKAADAVVDAGEDIVGFVGGLF